MNRQFSFKDASRAPPADQPRIPANWTDQRVQQIMKKYETPISKLNHPHQQNRRSYIQAPDRSPLRQNSNNASFIEPRNGYTPGKICRRTEEKSYQNNYEKDYQLGRENYQRSRPSEDCYQGSADIYQKQPESLTSQFWKERENIYDPDTYSRSNDKPQIREIYGREEISSYQPRDRKSSYNHRQISFNQRDNYREREIQPMNQPYSYARRQEPTISPQQDYRRVDYKLQPSPLSRQNFNQTQGRGGETRHRQSYNQTEGFDWTPTRKTSNRAVTEANEREPELKYTLSHTAFEQSPIVKASIKKNVNKIEYDSRISNIQRINQKIKRILATAGDDANIARQGRSLDVAARPSLSPFTQKQNLYRREEQTASRLKIGQIESSSRATQKEQKTPELNTNSKISSKSAKKQVNVETIENKKNVPEPREGRRDWQNRKEVVETRSRSCLMQNIKTEQSNQSGPKQEKNQRIQEQIQNFNNKIAQLQAEKRKLNISFTPSNNQVVNTTQSRSGINNNSAVPTPSAKKETIKQEEVKATKRQEKESELVLETPVSTQRYHEESQLQPPQSLIPAEGMIEESICDPDYDFSKDAIAQSPYVDFKDALNLGESQAEFQFCSEEELRNNVATRIEDRRRRLQALQQSSVGQSRAGNTETKRFLELLSEQVRLDQQFRLTKNWFINCELSSKYPLLQSILAARWRQMSLEEIQSDFRVNFEEDDPFYSYREDQFQLEDLVNNYIICNRHWQQHLQQQWNVQQLAQEGLLRALDLEGKQYVAIEDLVRVINMEEGTFYRNRDLYLVYQRLTVNNKNEQLRMDLFCAALAQRG